MKTRICLFYLATATLLLSGCGTSPTELKSAQEPHKPGPGSWFEGWYARSMDLGGGRSLAVIVGSHKSKQLILPTGQSGPGYIGILYSEGDGSPTLSWSYFPKETAITLEGKAVTSGAAHLNPTDRDFAWEAPGFGRFGPNGLEITVAGEVEVSMEYEAGKSWDENSPLPLGPESYLAALPSPLRWYVKSLNSPSRYRIAYTDKEGVRHDVSGQSQTHLEKNWGQVFPKAWNWLQATSIEDDAQIVLGGGTVGLLGLDVKALLAGYRSPQESWNIRFTDPGTRIVTGEGACQGAYTVQIKRPDLEVHIKAEAPRHTYGSVAVPTEEGFIPNFGAESFSATIEVSTYRPRWNGMRLTERRVFKNGALEFGAGSYNKGC